MKRFILLALVLAISCDIYAQDSQDKRGTIAGGNFSITIDNEKETQLPFSIPSGPSSPSTTIRQNKSFSLSLSKYIGISLTTKSILGFGLKGGYSQIKRISDGPNTVVESGNKNTSIGIGVFYRYCFFSDQKLNFFLQPNAEFIYSFGRNLLDEPELFEIKGNTFNLGINLGASYPITNKCG